MNEFNVEGCRSYADLQLAKFDDLNISVYVLSKQWNYMYVNSAVERNLGPRGAGLVGQNMWVVFPQLTTDVSFNQLKFNSERGVATNMITVSPITGKRLSIRAYILSDCYLFMSTILPNKEELLMELRSQLKQKQDDHGILS